MREMRSKNADSSRMGKAAEHLVAATCIIESRALLNVSTALVDDEGVDLVFHRRDGGATLAVQVKSRMSDSAPLNRGVFQAVVRRETMRPRRDLYVLFVAVDVALGTFDTCWLVPSLELDHRSRPNSRGRLRFVASPKSTSRDRWVEFRLDRRALPTRVLSLLDALAGEHTQMSRMLASVPERGDL
jgi:hypothetical protein